MKKLILLFYIATTCISQGLLAQDSTQLNPSALLSQYYAIKDALISSDASTASSSASRFVKSLNDLPQGQIPTDSKTLLLKDGTSIATSTDIRKQRESFATLSNSMTVLAKTVKLSSEPIYIQYCPMKKAGWLSSDKPIKNPYYGSAMLTCGKTSETIQR